MENILLVTDTKYGGKMFEEIIMKESDFLNIFIRTYFDEVKSDTVNEGMVYTMDIKMFDEFNKMLRKETKKLLKSIDRAEKIEIEEDMVNEISIALNRFISRFFIENKKIKDITNDYNLGDKYHMYNFIDSIKIARDSIGFAIMTLKNKTQGSKARIYISNTSPSKTKEIVETQI